MSKESDAFFRGADDYTYNRGMREKEPDYIRGYKEAEKASKKLAFDYLNYP